MNEVLIGGGHMSKDTHRAKTMERHEKKKMLSDINNNHANSPSQACSLQNGGEYKSLFNSLRSAILDNGIPSRPTLNPDF